MLKQRLSRFRWPFGGTAKAPCGSMAHCVSGSVAVVAAFTLCSVALTACKKKTPPPPAPQPELHDDIPETSESAAPAAPSPSPSPGPGALPTRCRELPQPAPFRIGEPVTARADDPEDGGPDDDDEVPDPYAVELGPARADDEGFTLSALHSVKRQTHALMAVGNADPAAGKVIDLGVVHGDPDPPLFASHGKDLLLV